ncbi:ceramidase domain-containing protein [uncultured Algibacter sp.]|uniref:ceramidase domain-containing protein n=1 Tax=uncultured Algibacter sp. TaxID=298659 RepID=UPI003216C431
MILKQKQIGYGALIVSGVLALILILGIPPISQSQEYHNFFDTHTFLSIPNFWNVVSNLPFMFVGVFGLWNLKFTGKYKVQYLSLFIGIVLVALGSGYYHINPNNTTLIWDRLPMAMVFMSLTSVVISQFINFEIGKKLLLPLVLMGVVSVLYWAFFDNLKPYVLVQFYPMLAIPIILLTFKSKAHTVYGYWYLMLAYVIAKVFEYFDGQIFNIISYVSGHSLKHIISAFGLLILLYSYFKKNENTIVFK